MKKEDKTTKQVVVSKCLADKMLIIAANLHISRQKSIDNAMCDYIEKHQKFLP